MVSVPRPRKITRVRNRTLLSICKIPPALRASHRSRAVQNALETPASIRM